MADCREFQFGLVCLIMAALTGLAGFAIIYHYATSERPVEQFAIVIDAGSTQTRSNLFTISVDAEKVIDWSSESGEFGAESEHALSQVIRVREVGSCVNGGPLAALKSEDGARKLLDGCLKKFARQIRKLDFLKSENLDEDDQFADSRSDADEFDQQLALLNHRVNSLTHMHLGATAGMRALSMINETRASEKLNWINRAMDESNRKLALGPYINKGYVNILAGADEAAFGWASVNFVCDRLRVQDRNAKFEPEPANPSSLNSNHLYDIGDEKAISKATNGLLPLDQLPESVGTVELGGASSQIAYQVPRGWSDEYIRNNISMESKNLNLFNANYKLATRSDLCLGMSQATLRVKFILLRDYYDSIPAEARTKPDQDKLIRIPTPCFQNMSKTNLSSSDIADILKAPCLVSSESDFESEQFKASMNNTKVDIIYQFVGTGNTDQCDVLLKKLLDPSICQQYFSLCPQEVNQQTKPPSNMSFVTISGYNKALQVLNLEKSQNLSATSESGRKLEELIGEKLGGYSIDYSQFISESKRFCSLDVGTFPSKFPKMHKVYYPINCMQLVYINKLLTEFHLFDPQTRWPQLKFLLFPVSSANSDSKHESKNDIGWTLGLLLNATSYQFSGDPSDAKDTNGVILFHYGASVAFIMRTTLILMLACFLLAMSLIVAAVFAVRRRSRKQSAYIDHSHDGVAPATPYV